MTTRLALRGIVVAAAVAGSLLAPAASAAVLRSKDGTKVTVLRQRVADLRTLAPSWGAAAGELRYEVVDGRTGSVATGTVPGGLRGALVPVLAEDPISGAVFLVYEADHASTSDVAFHYWEGQQWSEARFLTDDGAANHAPALTFDGDGDAVLAWQDDDGSVLLTQLRLSAAGVERVYSFGDLGSPALFAVQGDVRLRDGVAHVVASSAARRAWLFLADSTAERVAVADVDLAQLDDIWGGGAAPVPVTFAAPDAAPAPLSTGAGPEPFEDRTAKGTLIAPYRVEILGAEVYYWFEDSAIRVVAFRAGVPLPMLALDRPASDSVAHFAAFLAARHQLARGALGTGSRTGEFGFAERR